MASAFCIYELLVDNYGKDLANSNRSTPLSESRARNLRRLMSNSGRRRRSRTLMLVPNLRPKVVPHDGSRLLLGLIVRARGRLVARAPSPVSAQQARPSGPAVRIGSPHPRHPLPMAPLPQRKGLLALRFFAPAPLLPQVVHPRPTQPAHPSLAARVAPLAGDFAKDLAQPSAVYRVMDTTLVPAMVRVRASRKGLFLGQASFGRSASKTEWVYGFNAALVVDPNGVVTAFGLAPAASDERPIGEALVAEDHYDAYTWPTRASQGSSGNAIGWSNTGRLLRPPPRTIPAERGRRPSGAGPLASARS